MFKLQKLAGAARAQGELQFLFLYGRYSNVLNHYLTTIPITYEENILFVFPFI
jgi:hypothetical protein